MPIVTPSERYGAILAARLECAIRGLVAEALLNPKLPSVLLHLLLLLKVTDPPLYRIKGVVGFDTARRRCLSFEASRVGDISQASAGSSNGKVERSKRPDAWKVAKT